MPDINQAGSIDFLIKIKTIKDGVIFLKDGSIRKIISVSGSNLDLKSEDETNSVLIEFANLLNSIEFPIQCLVHSRKMNIEEYLQKLDAMASKEEDIAIRNRFEEYAEFINNLVLNNAIMTKDFFVVVPFSYGATKKISDEAEDSFDNDHYQKLNFRLNRVIQGLNQIGLKATVLDDEKLTTLLYNFYNPNIIDYIDSKPLEAIPPKEVSIYQDYLKINDYLAKSFFVSSYGRFINSGWLNQIINNPEIFDLSLHFSPVDTAIAIKNLSRKVTQISASLTEKQEKGLIRDPELETAYQDAEKLRDALHQGREKLFSISLYITIYAEDLDALKLLESKITSFFERSISTIQAPLFEQLSCFNSVLPLSNNELMTYNTMNTSPASAFFPFISPDVISNEGIVYGVNIHNNSLAILDRFQLENHNSVIFAKSGSGKSYTAKLEILRSIMMGADVLVIDPENEYQTLAESMHGEIVKISLTSLNSINPFDIPEVAEGEDPSQTLVSHIANLSGLLKIMIGPFDSGEDAIIDRALTEVYAARDITPAKDYSNRTPPVLEDLEIILRNTEGGLSLANRLYKFTKGSYAGFLNKPTSVNIKNRLVVFSIRDLEEELRPIAMYMLLGFVWNITKSKLKKRILVVDEAWIMMKHKESASFLFNLVRRARKYYLGITTITQNVEDFLNTEYGYPVISNSALQILLRQSSSTIDTVVKAFNLTSIEKNYLIQASVGRALLIADNKHIGVQILASPSEDAIITTKSEAILAQREKDLGKTENNLI